MECQRENDLAGKVVIITGASRGVGRRAALTFAKRGAKLVLAARTVERTKDLPGTLGDVIEEIKKLGGSAIAVATDLANRDDLKKLVAAAVTEFGGVDILVNNAAATIGPMWQKRFLDLTYEEWLYQFDVNLHAPFTLMQLVVPLMERRGGGRIINITTGSGEAFRLAEEPVPTESVMGRNLVVPGYFASKRALDRLASVIAPELRTKSIFVISIYPGFVETEVIKSRLEAAPADILGDGPRPIPMDVPARMTVYYAACEKPVEYTGRIFWAEKEMADLGVKADP